MDRQNDDEIAGLPARRAALRMLDAVLRRGETLDQAQHNACQGLIGPSGGADRALARALAGEVLRWMGDLDALIDSATREVLPDDAKARAVLRLMLAGWLRLETPPHAVIATGLPLLVGGPRRLAHGVFSTLARRGAEGALPDAPRLPAEVVARWPWDAEGIAAALALPPSLDLTLRDAGETQAWCERLEGVSLMPGHVRVARGHAIESLPGFDAGAWWVQDLAASLPARLLGAPAAAGARVLDVCAAPGGKTMQLAAAGWDVVALDSSEKRLERVSANLARVNLSAGIAVGDALEWVPAEAFDAVLLDAPCTATGTCRRHPEVLHRVGERQIADMAATQSVLLARAATWLKPGGTLVYAVCSLEGEEGEDIAAALDLAALGLVPQPVLGEELPAGLAPTQEGWLRTTPADLAESGGMDGFFIARWRRGY